MRKLCTVAAVSLALSACGSDPAPVGGNYTIAVTNQPDQCGLDMWEDGATNAGIPFVITQDGEAITGDLQGPVGLYFDVVVGTSTFVGSVDGEDLSMALMGTRAYNQGGCTWTLNATVNASIDGDVLTGTITYRAATNNSAECGALLTCQNTQAFNGTRPPT